MLTAADIRWAMARRQPLSPTPADDTLESTVAWLIHEQRVWKQMHAVALDRIAEREQQIARLERRNIELIEELRAIRKAAA
jgi:hypothetical protein